MTISTRTISSPVGDLHTYASAEGLHAVLWPGLDPARYGLKAAAEPSATGEAILDELATQLSEYFDGERSAFDVPVAPRGTEFQRAAWTALRRIPYGTTRTYTQQAEAIGRPRAVRAIGAANGRNPISIVIPCHRVVGADGRLTGFAGGLDAKRFLLELEASTRSSA